jgi:glyoxylase-like metal-dependent hydrolase (beta-lactamase superfamily II)
MCPLGARWLGTPGAPLGARGRLIAHCLLVETERDGLVLVDTGFGTRDCDRRTGLADPVLRVLGPALDRAETAVAQVIALGFRADDVRHVVVTHLDLDHAGGIGDFPAARVHLHAREHAAAMRRGSFRERHRYIAAHWSHGPHWEVYQEDGDTWRGVPAIARLRGIAADIGLVPLHGHTRGHSAVIVRDGARWLVHAGDAYFHRHALDDGGAVPVGLAAFERLAAIDDTARRASVASLRRLRAEHHDVAIFCAHDERELEAFLA